MMRRPVWRLAALAIGLVLAWPQQPRASMKPSTRAKTVNFLTDWYMGLSALETDLTPKHTSRPLTLELDADTRLAVPPHLASQSVVNVERVDLGPDMADAVLVGIDAATKDGLRQAYALLYVRAQGRMELRAEMPLRESFDKFEVARLGADESVVIVTGTSGRHFTDVWVYGFSGGQPELLFENGTAAGVEIRYGNQVSGPTIWLAVEDWSDPQWSFADGEARWIVYTWNGDEFAYSDHLSTSRETTVSERLAFYTIATLRRMEGSKERTTPANPSLSPADAARRADLIVPATQRHQ